MTEPPRFLPVESLSAEQARMLQKTVPPNGDRMNVFRAMAHHAPLMERFCAFTQILRNEGRVPLRNREIVILRVAWRTGSVYEFGSHTIVARRAGLDEAEIQRTTEPGVSGWDEQDALLVQLVDELHDADQISDTTWAGLARTWDRPELIELVLLVGLYHMTAWFMNGLRIPADPELPGWPDTAA